MQALGSYKGGRMLFLGLGTASGRPFVLGGGNVDELDELPHGWRRGDNRNAFTGGFRLWDPAFRPRVP